MNNRRKLILLLMGGLLIAAGVLVGNKVINKAADLRYRFQLLERRVASLGEVASAPLKRHQAQRGEARFRPVNNKALKGSWRSLGGVGSSAGWEKQSYLKAKALAVHDSDLYVGLLGAGKGSAAVWRYDGTRWSLEADSKSIPGWDNNSYVQDLHSSGADLYAGVDDEVWRLSGGNWSKVTGAEGSFPWPDRYNAYAIETHQSKLYVGLTGLSAKVFRYDGMEWEDVSQGLPAALTNGVYELFEHTDNRLYAAVTAAGGAGSVYRFEGTHWSRVGGAGLNGSWISEGSTYPLCFASYQDSLVVTLNRNPQTAGQFVSVWALQGEEWFPVGPFSIPEVWSETDNFNACLVFNDLLYVGGGGRPAGNAGIYVLDSGRKWKQVGGHGTNGSWSPGRSRMSGWQAPAEYVYRMISWRGQIIAGFGDGPAAAQVWAYTPDKDSRD